MGNVFSQVGGAQHPVEMKSSVQAIPIYDIILMFGILAVFIPGFLTALYYQRLWDEERWAKFEAAKAAKDK